jgi:membrane-bound lytic murein transglycosylase A
MGSEVIYRGHLAAVLGSTLLTIVACAGPAAAQAGSEEVCRDLLRTEDQERAASLREAARRTLAAPSIQAPAAEAVRSAAEGLLDAMVDARASPFAFCAYLSLERVNTPVLLTGYYRPLVPARREPDATFRFPLYALPPPDLRRLPRAAIDAGALGGRSGVVAWLADPIEAFFIHIQGSAVLSLPQGEMAVGFAGSNDRAYTSIGAVLVESGRMRREDVSMESLKQYLRDHPSEREALLQRNERYIYFHTIGSEAIGSLGVPLTDGRSVAADPAVYPPGTLLFIRPREADPDITPRLVFVQDRGSAITGPGRLDLYLGTGDEAGRIAGPLQEIVDVFVVRGK